MQAGNWVRYKLKLFYSKVFEKKQIIVKVCLFVICIVSLKQSTTVTVSNYALKIILEVTSSKLYTIKVEMVISSNLRYFLTTTAVLVVLGDCLLYSKYK